MSAGSSISFLISSGLHSQGDDGPRGRECEWEGRERARGWDAARVKSVEERMSLKVEAKVDRLVGQLGCPGRKDVALWLINKSPDARCEMPAASG